LLGIAKTSFLVSESGEREMGLSIVFSCVLEKPKMLEAILGGKINPRRLSQLSPGVALTRICGTDEPIEVQTWKP
jgi:hypothetical protein